MTAFALEIAPPSTTPDEPVFQVGREKRSKDYFVEMSVTAQAIPNPQEIVAGWDKYFIFVILIVIIMIMIGPRINAGHEYYRYTGGILGTTMTLLFTLLAIRRDAQNRVAAKFR